MEKLTGKGCWLGQKKVWVRRKGERAESMRSSITEEREEWSRELKKDEAWRKREERWKEQGKTEEERESR